MGRFDFALRPGQARYTPQMKAFDKSVCASCGLPRSWHKFDAAGNIVLNAQARAWYGDTKPTICWAHDLRRGNTDLAIKRPFHSRVRGRRVA